MREHFERGWVDRAKMVAWALAATIVTQSYFSALCLAHLAVWYLPASGTWRRVSRALRQPTRHVAALLLITVCVSMFLAPGIVPRAFALHPGEHTVKMTTPQADSLRPGSDRPPAVRIEARLPGTGDISTRAGAGNGQADEATVSASAAPVTPNGSTRSDLSTEQYLQNIVNYVVGAQRNAPLRISQPVANRTGKEKGTDERESAE